MKKIILGFSILIFTFLFSSCSEENIELPKKYYSTWAVFSGSINIRSSYIWYIESKETVQLSPKVWWRIVNIHVDEWDYVNAWDVLATLDSSEAKLWYSTAQNIVSSLYDMKNSTLKMFDEQILAMESKVEQVRLWEQWLKDWLEDAITITNAQLETAKTWVEAAKTNLDHTKQVLETKENHIYDNSKNAIVSAIIIDTNIINFVDELLWISHENRDKNDSFEDYLSAKNKAFLNDAESKFLEAKTFYDDYKYFYDNEIEWKNPDRETILKWLNKWEQLAELLKELLNIVYNVVDNSIDNYYFSVDTINNYKKTISDFWNYIESSLLTVSWEYILWLKWSRQALDDFEKSSIMQIELLEKEHNLAEKTYIQYQAMNDWQLREISTNSKVASSWLDEILSWLEALKQQKNAKLREIDISIKDAELQKNTAWVMIDSWVIKSPINGLITMKNAEVWQVVWWWTPILLVSNKENLELNILISEEQSKNISLNTKVLLELEWFDKQLFWLITNIASSKDIVTKKVWVEISLNNLWENIKIWTFTKVIFDNSNEGIVIPNSAIISKFMIPWVYVLEDKKVKFKNIEILRQNDQFSEINSLNVWEILITEWKENIWDGEELK